MHGASSTTRGGGVRGDVVRFFFGVEAVCVDLVYCSLSSAASHTMVFPRSQRGDSHRLHWALLSVFYFSDKLLISASIRMKSFA